jgi:DnaK suppressor protein
MMIAATRHRDLRQILVDRQRELLDGFQSRLRDERADRPTGGDELERSDADREHDIELKLLQMKAETLVRIDAALIRLDAGLYGRCFECGGEIANRRLRALPFAVRCQACEEQREQAREEAHQLAQRRSTPLFRSAFVDQPASAG